MKIPALAIPLFCTLTAAAQEVTPVRGWADVGAILAKIVQPVFPPKCQNE